MSNKIDSFRVNVSKTLKSAISAGLRSCDDTTDVISAGNEFVVGSRKAMAAWGTEVIVPPQEEPRSMTQQFTVMGEQRPNRIESHFWGEYSFKVAIQWLDTDQTDNSNVMDQLGGTVKVSAWTENKQDKKKLPLNVQVLWSRRCAGITFPQLNYSSK